MIFYSSADYIEMAEASKPHRGSFLSLRIADRDVNYSPSHGAMAS